jgi:putative transposase
MDETYIKVNGQWKYLYCAVDKECQTIDFLLTAHRDKQAALRFLRKAVRQHGFPDKITIDKSGANTAAMEVLNEGIGQEIEIRQMQVSEQPGRAGSPGHQTNCPAHARIQILPLSPSTLCGIELMHMIKKGQMIAGGSQNLSAAEQLYSLAAKTREGTALHLKEINAIEPREHAAPLMHISRNG